MIKEDHITKDYPDISFLRFKLEMDIFFAEMKVEMLKNRKELYDILYPIDEKSDKISKILKE